MVFFSKIDYETVLALTILICLFVNSSNGLVRYSFECAYFGDRIEPKIIIVLNLKNSSWQKTNQTKTHSNQIKYGTPQDIGD